MFNANERIPCITTTDNPHNPFTEFEDWEKFDIKNGYFTCYTLEGEALDAEQYMQMAQDRYYVDFGKAVVMGMICMVCKDEKLKKRTDLRQILPRNVHYRIVWKDEEPE